MAAQGGCSASSADAGSSALQRVGRWGNTLLRKPSQGLPEVVIENPSCKNILTFALSHHERTQESVVALKAACSSREENSPGKSTQ